MLYRKRLFCFLLFVFDYICNIILSGLIGNCRNGTRNILMENNYLWEIIYTYFFYDAVSCMTVLARVLCSTVVLITCLHNHGTILGMHIQYVFMSVLCTCLSAFLYFKSQSIVDKTYLHIDNTVI